MLLPQGAHINLLNLRESGPPTFQIRLNVSRRLKRFIVEGPINELPKKVKVLFGETLSKVCFLCEGIN